MRRRKLPLDPIFQDILMFDIDEDQDDAEFFYLNPSSGLLSLARPLTVEDQVEYKVSVTRCSSVLESVG